jgi:hypothetical protein
MQLACPLHVAPDNADRAWGEAAMAASAHIGALPAGEIDCKLIIVEVNPRGAVLSVTTSDGRRAARPIAAPSEIAPVLRALITTVPDATMETPTEPVAERVLPRASPEVGRESQAAARSARPAWWFVVGGGGGRIGFVDWVGASPTATLSLGLLAGPLETGISGSMDFSYAYLSSSKPAGFGMASQSIDVFVGYRPAVGALHVAAGLDAGVSLVQETVNLPSYVIPGTGNGSSEDVTVSGSTVRYTPVEMQVGGYAAAIVPIWRGLRFRPQVGVHVLATRFGSAPSSYDLPALPGWGCSLLLGFEGDGS